MCEKVPYDCSLDLLGLIFVFFFKFRDYFVGFFMGGAALLGEASGRESNPYMVTLSGEFTQVYPDSLENQIFHRSKILNCVYAFF